MTSSPRIPLHIFWSRRDFRHTDNPALSQATRSAKEESGAFLPIFILEDYMTKGDPHEQFGYPQRAWLSNALPEFSRTFPAFLTLLGKGASCMIDLCTQARSHGYEPHVHVNHDIYQDFFTQCKKIRDAGISLSLYRDALTIPSITKTGSGSTYSVFTPFKKAVWNDFLLAPCLASPSLQNLTKPSKDFLNAVGSAIDSTPENLRKLFSQERTLIVRGERDHIIDLEKLLPEKPLIDDVINEQQAQHRFKKYLNNISTYHLDRDNLERDVTHASTSHMSTALAWGLVSTRWMKQEILHHEHLNAEHVSLTQKTHQGATTYLSELIWREFYKYLFLHHKNLMREEFQSRYRGTLSWTEDTQALRYFKAWIQGSTGYPLVDAAMRQLAKTGRMHNRARMVVASVLTKNFGVDWRWGQEYFRAQLIDLDEASNCGGWQWAASVGADPKPIRIFNPQLQAKTHDPQGTYEKYWLGEVYMHNPPQPIIDHKTARMEALSRYHHAYTKSD